MKSGRVTKSKSKKNLKKKQRNIGGRVIKSKSKKNPKKKQRSLGGAYYIDKVKKMWYGETQEQKEEKVRAWKRKLQCNESCDGPDGEGSGDYTIDSDCKAKCRANYDKVVGEKNSGYSEPGITQGYRYSSNSNNNNNYYGW